MTDLADRRVDKAGLAVRQWVADRGAALSADKNVEEEAVMRARLWVAAVVAVGLSLPLAANSAPVTLTGEELLTSPNASFPSVQPTLAGTALVFAGGAPVANLVRYRVNPASTLPLSGEVTISATWNLTRLECSGACSGGGEDWDPHLFLTDGTKMIGFQLGDNNDGEVWETSATDTGTGADRLRYGQQIGTGYPGINSSINVFLSFTLHDDGVTARILYPNVDRSFTLATPLARTSNLALTLTMDNDTGERYQVNSLQIPDTGTAPEPGTLALAAIGVLGFGLGRRRRQ